MFPTRSVNRRATALVATVAGGLAASLLVALASAPASAAPAAPTSPHGTAGRAAKDAGTTTLPPVSVALDASLVKPQDGDSAATRQARAGLANAQRTYAAANQAYDAAAAAAAQAQDRLAQARTVAVAAQLAADNARSDLQAIALRAYEDSNPVPISVQVLLTSAGGGDVLDDLARQQQIQGFQAQQTSDALDAQSIADHAAIRLEVAQADADRAEAAAVAAERTAAQLVTDAQHAVAELHIKDLEAAAAAAAARARVAGSRSAGGQDSAAAAAAALQAQALTSGAATAASFPANATVVATIAIATRALLAKAAKHGTDVRDETDVMGPAPDLGGSVPFTQSTGSQTPVALQVFDGRISTVNWPGAGVGTKVKGTAPFLKSDGVNVHPVLPPYGKKDHSLRAQVAVDSALEQLGSPYVWDAAGPDTYDCSGLTLWAWGHAGVALEHFTGKQVQEGAGVIPAQLLPGDLLLFGKDLHHVGMYLGAGYMIDAPDTGDYVKIQLVSDMGDFTVAVRP